MSREKKSVAILVQNLHNGGAERMAANLSIELAKYYDVYLIVFDAQGAIYPYGGKLIDLKVPPLAEASAATRIRNILTRIRRLSYIKKKYRIDCTISHMEGANLVNIFARRGDKILTMYHSMPSRCMEPTFVHSLMHAFTGKHSAKYLCVSRLAEQDMAENFGVKPKYLSYVYNFSDLEKIGRLQKEQLTEKAALFYAAHPRVMITVGRLTHMKAQDRLIRMLKTLRENDNGVGLVILGEGEERPLLEELAEELKVKEHVLLPGEVENPFPYMKKAKAFALPSDYEGLPMVLIEAAACTLPVVSCDIQSGPREVLAPDTDITKATETIEYAQYGILVPALAEEPRRGKLSEKEQMMAQAIRELLTDDALRRRYCESSAACAERFSSEQIIGRWRELIEG